MNNPQSSSDDTSSQVAVLVALPGSYRIAAYVRAAHELDLQPIVVTEANAAAVPPRTIGVAVDLADTRAVLDRVERALAGRRVVAVIGLDDGTVETAARLANHFNLRHNSPLAARLSARKDLSRRALQAAGLPVPPFTPLPAAEALPAASVPSEPPWVVKPLSLSASRGVIRADDLDGLNRAVARARRIAADAGSSGDLLLERYVEGQEVAVDAIMGASGLQLLAMFDKPNPLRGPFFEESIYVTPSTLSANRQKEVLGLTERCCHALGITSGPVHAEYRLDRDSIWVIEVASRTVGGDCAQLFRSMLPYSLERLVLESSLGRSLKLRAEGSFGVYMLPVRKGGVLRRVNGIAAAEKVVGVTEVRISIREGYELIPWPEGCSYPGFVFARGNNADAVITALCQAAAEIRFVVSPKFPLRVAKAKSPPVVKSGS